MTPHHSSVVSIRPLLNYIATFYLVSWLVFKCFKFAASPRNILVVDSTKRSTLNPSTELGDIHPWVTQVNVLKPNWKTFMTSQNLNLEVCAAHGVNQPMTVAITQLLTSTWSHRLDLSHRLLEAFNHIDHLSRSATSTPESIIHVSYSIYQDIKSRVDLSHRLPIMKTYRINSSYIDPPKIDRFHFKLVDSPTIDSSINGTLHTDQVNFAKQVVFFHLFFSYYLEILYRIVICFSYVLAFSKNLH